MCDTQTEQTLHSHSWNTTWEMERMIIFANSCKKKVVKRHWWQFEIIPRVLVFITVSMHGRAAALHSAAEKCHIKVIQSAL